MTVAGRIAPVEIHQNRRLVGGLNYAQTKIRQSRYNARAQRQSICHNFGRLTRQQKSFDLGFGAVEFQYPGARVGYVP